MPTLLFSDASFTLTRRSYPHPGPLPSSIGPDRPYSKCSYFLPNFSARCLLIALMMEEVRSSETSVNYLTDYTAQHSRRQPLRPFYVVSIWQ
jgi:hypothetical protein